MLVLRIDKAAYDMTIDGSGKVYPGFIAPNSTLGLVEIDAIKSSDDENEIGQMNQMLGVAFNAESKVIETVRPNGILIAHYTSWRAHIWYIIHSSIRRLDLGRCNHERK
jgi:hypothetical protein